MQKIKALKICILISLFISLMVASNCFAHTGHGKAEIPEFMHQALYPMFFAWGLFVLMAYIGIAIFFYNRWHKNRMLESHNSYNYNNDCGSKKS